MGIFTWTDARKVPKRNKWGDFAIKDVIGYGGFAKVVCPDNTEIVEECYDGYGIFGGKDIYELVAQWNQADIAEIVKRKKAENDSFYRHLEKNAPGIIDMFAAGKSDEEITAVIRQMVEDGTTDKFTIRDWKRGIGIMISCKEEDNNSLRYPIKITRETRHCAYEDLVPSISTQ